MNKIREEPIETEEEIIERFQDIGEGKISIKSFMENNKDLNISEKSVYNYIDNYLKSINVDLNKKEDFENEFLIITYTPKGYKKCLIKNERLFIIKVLKETKVGKSKKELKSILGISTTLKERVRKEHEFFETDSGITFPKNKVSFIRGNGGVGKTYLLIRFIREIIKKENRKVFGWFSEDDLGLSKKRFENIFEVFKQEQDIKLVEEELQEKKDLDNFYENVEISDSSSMPFFDKKKNSIMLEPTEFLNRLKDYCIDKDIIILDPLIGFVGRRGENDNVLRKMFMEEMNKWRKQENKTIIFIHHIKKNNSKTEEINEYDLFRGRSRYVDRLRFARLVSFSKDSEGNEIKHKRNFKIVKNNYSRNRDSFDIQLFKKEEENTDSFFDTKTNGEDEKKISYGTHSEKDVKKFVEYKKSKGEKNDRYN